jgi:hypothetical protein
MPPYGSDDSGFNASSKAYKQDPSLERYVKLRRENPEAEIEVSLIGGLDPLLSMNKELERYGFDPDLVAGGMDADPEAISALSLQIMEKMIEARELARKETHLARRGLAIPEKLITWLTLVMLDALSWNDHLYIPRDLIVLIREQLGGPNSEYQRQISASHGRSNAILVGAQMIAKGIKPSFRLVADVLRVHPTTVLRWFPQGDFLKQVESFAHFFDANGEMRPLASPTKRRGRQKRSQRQQQKQTK